MKFSTARDFARARPDLPDGVVAILLCESDRHADASAKRLAAQGASVIIAVGASPTLPDPGCAFHRIDQAPNPKEVVQILQTLLTALKDRWVIWLWNSEFFVFPFGEARSLADLTAFLGDERRPAIQAYTFDLYAKQLPAPAEDPQQVPMYFDRIGYYAFPEADRTLRLRGGLGWRFEEFTPPDLQPISRAVMLKPGEDLVVGKDLTFGGAEYDSVNCPWHRNPTAAVMSLRRSRRIMAHPGFPSVAHKLMWPGSTPFEWTSSQLLGLGMIEPGQWF
ncbi:MAG: hypothetical protein AAF557_18225 [Pseudomonadota bacterium]